jgi:TolB-like protein
MNVINAHSFTSILYCMASIIPGYQYDIFISYRHNDNRSGWVTDFIAALQDELASTMKEPVSVYFDTNPHDGLLETHSVEKSLESKLKCLILIPVLSQTYCDPKCYAWQNELLPFNKFANEDSFGKDIKLKNGNYASRVLPIKIHDIEQRDINLFEKVTGSVLRSIDFIFQTSTGVNRPLRSNEDHPSDNLNKTYYRDQINKVANAINEIFRGVNPVQSYSSEEKNVIERSFIKAEAEKRTELNRAEAINLRSKRIPLILISVILCIAAVIVIFKTFVSGEKVKTLTSLEKSIAILPFRNDSPNDTNAYFINGLMEEILNHLQMIRDLRVISRTSVEQYRNTTKSVPQIAKEQGVNYVVEGSGQKYGHSFNVRIQLIRAAKENQLWSKSYDQEIRDASDILNVQSKIAQSIVAELKASITPEEKQLIEKVHTTNLNAYDFYQRGREELLKFWIEDDNDISLERAGKLFGRALEFDPAFAEAYAGQAEVMVNKNFWKDMFSENYLDSVLILANKALSYDDQLAEAYFAKGAYYDAKGMKEKALAEYDKTLKLNPNYWMAYNAKAMLYELDDQVKYLDNLKKAALINQSSLVSPKILMKIGGKLEVTGFKDKALFYYKKAFDLDNDSAYYLSNLGGVESDLGNYEKSLYYFKRAYMNRANYTYIIERLGEDYLLTGMYKESLKYFKEYNALVEDHNPKVAYAYWQNGMKKEAERYLNHRLEFCQNILKTNHSNVQIYWAYYDLAAIYGFKGDKGNAIKNLKLFSQNKNVEIWMLTHIRNDPMLNNIRNEPEFSQILNEMETNYKAVHERVGKWLEEQQIL